MQRRPCWVEISTTAFEDNYRFLTESVSEKSVETGSSLALLAIVKADAYGHSLRLCAPAAVRAGARWLGVTSVEEAAVARELVDAAGFPETGILVIGGVFAGQSATAIASRLTAVVWDAWQVGDLETAAVMAGCEESSIPVHLELDTGMSRQGAGASELNSMLELFSTASPLRLDGLMTHLYAADESYGVASREQMALLARMVERVFAAGQRPRWLHVGNSAAVLAGEVPRELRQLAERFGMRPMARPGLALYGLAPEFSPDEPEVVTSLRGGLKQVLEWKTRVVSLRSVEPGTVVGYNGTFVATEPMRLALLAVGYADGLRRGLSNRGAVLVGGCRAPIVGRISMDQTVVDVTGISDVAAGDEVVLIGRQGEELISAEDHARWAGTIPWEIFTSITARVQRQGIGNRG